MFSYFLKERDELKSLETHHFIKSHAMEKEKGKGVEGEKREVTGGIGDNLINNKKNIK